MTFRLSNYRNLKKQQQIFSYCQIEDRIVVDQLLMMSRYRDEQPLNVSFDLMKIAVEHVKEIIFFFSPELLSKYRIFLSSCAVIIIGCDG